MIKNNAPLIQLRVVIVKLFVLGYEGPHRVAIPIRTIRQQGVGIDALRREIVEAANQPLSRGTELGEADVCRE